MPYYAQITEDGICTAVSELRDEANAPHLVPINALSAAPLGRRWDGSAWHDVPVPPVANPTEWLMDVGPFFDRFGAAKMPVLASQDTTVRALVTDLQVRKWIDLKRPDVAQGIDLLISKSLVAPAAKAAILTTPVDALENLALRKNYFA